MSSGLTATGLLLLLLAFIGAGVGLYYAYICLQARPLRPKNYKDPEHGPLIPPDPDVNGNHEDVPLDPSAPLHEEANGDLRLHPDLPDEDDTSPPPQGAESPEVPKDKEDVLITVEGEVPPARVTHEKETPAPVVNQAAPLGFVVPGTVSPPQETAMDHHPVPRNLQPQPEKLESPPSTSSAPVPVYIPSPPQKKPIAISDEEDGLLLHEPLQHDDSLNPDHCATLPVSHSPRKPCLNEEPEIIVQPSPPGTSPQPEGLPPTTPRQPAVVPKVDNTSEPEAQPVAVVLPQTAPSHPEKEELKPVGKAADTLPSEDCEVPVPVCIKEPLTSEPTNENLNQEKPLSSTDKAPVLNTVPSESPNMNTQDDANKETAIDSDDSLCGGDPAERTEPTPKSVEPTKNSQEDKKAEPSLEEMEPVKDIKPEPLLEDKTEPMQDNKPEPPPEKTDAHDETGSVSDCSVSSQESPPPSYSPASVDSEPHADPNPVTPVESSHPQPTEGEEVKADKIPVVAVETPSDVTPANTTEAESTSGEDFPPNIPLHTTPIEDEDISDASLSDMSDTNNEDENIPIKVTASPCITEMDAGKQPPIIPSVLPANIPIDASNVPMEGYNVMLDDMSDDDDDDDDDDGPLPVIKEEGSTENNSEGSTDTESSEPEVTEYSFSSGPSAPSTTGVLANEVSCTLEPKVTKFTPITDLDASESEDLEISDDNSEEGDSASLPDEVHDNMDSPIEDKVIDEEKPANVTEKSNADTPQKASVPDVKSIASTNGPVTAETPDPASKPPQNEVPDSGDSSTESEGAEAEVEVKEETVTVPTVVHEKSNKCIASPPQTQTSPSVNHNSAQASPPKPQLLKSSQGNSNSLEEIPTTTDDDDDGLSLSPSESCDLSDGDVTASTPKKSLIPRFVKHSEA